MTAMINTGLLTDELLDSLTTQGILVGDGVAPKEGGWTSGAPNVDAFRSYTVVSYDGGTPAMEGVQRFPEWLINIALRHYGGSRLQVDWQSNKTRNALNAIEGTVFEAHKVIGVQWRSLGAVSRIDQTDPSMWQAFDSVSLHCAVTR